MILYIFYFFCGTILGSFLNVVIYRIPKSLSIIQPRSFCPSCKEKIPFYYNIPIISYIILKGKCSNCNYKISVQYPIIEIIIGGIFIYSFNNYLIYESLLFIIISSLLICIAIIDLHYYIISLPLVLIGLFFILLQITVSGNIMYYIFGLIMGLGYLSFIFIITWIILRKQPLGFGDLILITLLGLWLGPLKILITIFLSAIVGLIYWISISLFNGFEKNKKLPFGTFLSLTSILVYSIEINWELFSAI